MKTKNSQKFLCSRSGNSISRREVIKSIGLATAGLMMSPYLFGGNELFRDGSSRRGVKVAATLSNNYSQPVIKQKIEHLFDSLDGIDDIINSGDKVGIKINITGGSNWANHSQLNGVDIRECAWTHPEVLRAVTECIIDSGVNPGDIYFLEALWDWDSYDNFGYKDIQEQLGVNVVNLNEKDPYTSFINIPSTNGYFYDSFILNQILDDIDVFVSIPKMKQHYEAAMTHSMKNLVGITPLEHYQLPSQGGIRSKIHFDGGDITKHLPRAICDLNMACPVHLAIIDGVKNATGGEGPWNPTFSPAEHGVLLAGKDAVATDSVATFIMGQNPELEELEKPNGMMCDNHLYLASVKGMGTNKMNDIELVGDGAGGIFGLDEKPAYSKSDIILHQNYPNPVLTATTISFYLPASDRIKLTILNSSGKIIETLADNNFERGKHRIQWSVGKFTSGIYFYRLKTSSLSQMRMMLVR